MSAREYRTSSEEQTIEVGRELGRSLTRPAVVLLTGKLGAGKTTLTKGIAEGLGAAVRDDVSSPTFTLIHEYGAEVYHLDLYRIETAREFQSLGLDDLFDRDSVVLIEWGERWAHLLPPATHIVRICAEGDDRTIEVTSATPHA